MQPAFEKVYPSITSQFILMMLMSSVASQISAEELTAVANNVQSITFLSLESYIVVAILYLILAMLLRVLFWLGGLGLRSEGARVGKEVSSSVVFRCVRT